MPRQESDRPDRSLLLLISESRSLLTGIRSRDRDIHSWQNWDSGDPTQPSSYEWTRAARSVTAVIDLQPPERSRAALAALRSVRPDSAVLLLSAETEDLDGVGDGTLARPGRLRDVLRLDLDEELVRLEAERRVYCLREFAAGDDVVPILIHAEPDPDALSSAFAVVALLGGPAARTPIVTLEEITRPETRRMAELLRISVTQVTVDELRRFERIITVDTQPHDLQREGRPRFAVIDHHPLEQTYQAEFIDVRPDYGATATMMTEYLRSGGDDRISRGLATALLYGIRTDTDSLIRHVSPADVDAYAHLQTIADLQLVRRFERASYSRDCARTFGTALANADVEGELCVVFLGEIPADDSHMLVDLADFCTGIENVTWVCVAALLEDQLVLTLRHLGGDPGAGGVARAIVDTVGLNASGGGHGSMARAVLPADVAAVLTADGATRGIRDLVRDAMDGLNRRALHRARPA